MQSVVLDTESSVDPRAGIRRLVALAYGLASDSPPHTKVYIKHSKPTARALARDGRSRRIHGIDCMNPPDVRLDIITAIETLFQYLEHHQVDALVGHGIAGDVSLILSEALYCGMSANSFPKAFRQILCTKVATLHICAIPLPGGQVGQNGYKWPRLKEAQAVLCGADGDPSEGYPHDPSFDVSVCQDVWLMLTKAQVAPS